MFLAIAMWATLAAPGADPANSAVDCLWQALPTARREALAALPYDPVFESRLEKSYMALPAEEIEATAARCGAKGMERWPAAAWAIQAAAQRTAAEAALQPRYPAARLEAAFLPLRSDVEAAGLVENSEIETLGDFVATFEVRFLDGLDANAPPAERAALRRYLEARIEAVMADFMWREIGRWEALSEEEKVRLMTGESLGND